MLEKSPVVQNLEALVRLQRNASTEQALKKSSPKEKKIKKGTRRDPSSWQQTLSPMSILLFKAAAVNCLESQKKLQATRLPHLQSLAQPLEFLQRVILLSVRQWPFLDGIIRDTSSESLHDIHPQMSASSWSSQTPTERPFIGNIAFRITIRPQLDSSRC